MAEHWEYLTKSLGINPQKDLAKLGQEGWELVSVTQWDRVITAYLKRRIRDEHRGENADG